MAHKEIIIEKYQQRVPFKILAEDEDVSVQTIWHYLRQWGINKRESIIRKDSQEDWKKFIKDSLPFTERISPETLLKMKENTRINKLYIKTYSLREDRFIIKIKKKILEGS